MGADRPRAGRHRGAGLPRLLPDRVGHRRSSAERGDIFCQGRGSAANSAVCYALGITKADAVRSACCSSGSSRPSATARPTSTSTSRAAAARRPSSTSTSATGGRTPPRSPTSSPTGRARRCGTWPRRSARRTGQQDAWSKQLDAWGGIGRTVADGDHEIPAEVHGAGGGDRALPPAPRHPLRRHGAVRPAGGRGVPGRVGAHGGPQRPAVGQGRLRRGRPGEVRPARPRACSPRCTTPST